LPSERPGEKQRGQDASTGIERILPGVFLSIRAVHVSQGVLCWITGRKAYRRPWLMGLMTVGAVAELGWLFQRTRRVGRHDATAARIDALFGALGLAVISVSTSSEDRTSSINWIMPLSVGGALGFSFALERTEGLALTTGLASIYFATVADALRSKGGSAATAVANIVSYPGFFLVGHSAVVVARRMAGEVDRARYQEVERSAELASERERNAAHRMIHDSALQTLEVLSRDTSLSLSDVRKLAAAEAVALRRAITDRHGEPTDLVVHLHDLTERLRGRGLRVELVSAELIDDPGPAITAALCDAAGEALTNVAKHASVDRVVVRVASAQGGIRLTVRDHGRGYDTATHKEGFGQRHSIRKRMQEVGGRSEIWSEPDQGTRVELWAPS
jgi:signal transduction histidine kinase